MADQWYKFGAGFLLVYSITDRPTFEAIPNFHQDILRVKDRTGVPCVVVSNKVWLPLFFFLFPALSALSPSSSSPLLLFSSSLLFLFLLPLLSSDSKIVWTPC